MPAPDVLTRDEALRALKVKPATLYAYVSRGLVRRFPAQDARRSVYAREDIEKLTVRTRRRMGRAAAAETAMRWGEPVINTMITQITPKGPVFRSVPAIDLAGSGVSFEAVCHFLMTGMRQPEPVHWRAEPPAAAVRDLCRRSSGLLRAAELEQTMAMLVIALGMNGRSDTELKEGNSTAAAREVVRTLAGCFGFHGPRASFAESRAGESVARHVLRASGLPAPAEAERALNRALVVLADHELAAASFVARVAASSGCDIYNCVAAAISSHHGMSTGAGPRRVEAALFDELGRGRPAPLFALVREHGTSLFGFNHPLYPGGDPRADYVLGLVRALPDVPRNVVRFLEFLDEARVKLATAPGIAIALVALSRALGMPPMSAGPLWILSRSAGWLAHILEQRTQAFALRPRARYVGVEGN